MAGGKCVKKNEEKLWERVKRQNEKCGKMEARKRVKLDE